MKRIALIIFINILCFNLKGQSNDTAYIYTFGGIQDEVCNQIIPTYDKGYITIGTTNSFGAGYNNFYVIKIDSLCHHQWSETYGGSQVQEGFSVSATSDHGYAFLGFTNSYGNGGYDVYLVKTDSMGKQQWYKTYGGSNWDFGYSIQQLSDKGFIICGLTYSYGPGNGNAYIIRTDSIGDTIWTRAIGNTGYYSIANSVCVHEDSLYFIAGASTANNNDTNTLLMEINNKGILKWDTIYHSIHNNAANSIRRTSDNGFLVYGYTDSIPSSDSMSTGHSQILTKTDSNGRTQWTQIYYNTITTGTGKDALECTNGNYLTVGTIYGGGAYSYQMNIQNASGGGWLLNGLLFQGGVGDEQGNSIAYRNKNNIVFGGATTYGAGDLDVYLVRFTSDSIQASYNLVKNYYTDTTLLPEGISELNALQMAVKVYPNPVVSSTTVLVQGEIGQKYLFNLFDETGKWLIQNMSMQQTGHGQSVILIYKNDLNVGSYIYTISELKTAQKVATGKILVE